MISNLVVQSLFSDGHIRYSVEARPEADAAGGGLWYVGVREELIPHSLDAMGWVLGAHGMRMMLAREVPELIAGALRGFLGRLWEDCGVGA